LEQSDLLPSSRLTITERSGIPATGAPFLGPERFVKKIAKETILPPVFRRLPLKDLLKRVSAKAEFSSDILLREGGLANVV
jgi:hypothetical protein